MSDDTNRPSFNGGEAIKPLAEPHEVASIQWLWHKASWFAFADDDNDGPIDFGPIMRDKEWEMIKDYGDLPDEARNSIDACIGLFRMTKENSAVRYPGMGKRINVLSKALAVAADQLNRAMVDRKLWDAWRMGIEGDVPYSDEKVSIGKQRTEQLRNSLRAYLVWLQAEIWGRATPEETRPVRSGYLSGLFDALDEILTHYGSSKKVTTGESGRNSFANRVCGIADRNLNYRDEIRPALRAYLRGRREIDK
jgi:hypothetical protein